MRKLLVLSIVVLIFIFSAVSVSAQESTVSLVPNPVYDWISTLDVSVVLDCNESALATDTECDTEIYHRPIGDYMVWSRYDGQQPHPGRDGEKLDMIYFERQVVEGSSRFVYPYGLVFEYELRSSTDIISERFYVIWNDEGEKEYSSEENFRHFDQDGNLISGSGRDGNLPRVTWTDGTVEDSLFALDTGTLDVEVGDLSLLNDTGEFLVMWVGATGWGSMYDFASQDGQSLSFWVADSWESFVVSIDDDTNELVSAVRFSFTNEFGYEGEADISSMWGEIFIYNKRGDLIYHLPYTPQISPEGTEPNI